MSKDNQNTTLKIFGFPCAYPPDHAGTIRFFQGNFDPLDLYGKKIQLYQYGLVRKDRITMIDTASFKIGYGISTLPGQSGCPVVINDSIIAVHVGGFKA